MAQLSKETILELQRILKEEYGKNLSFVEDTEAANNLVGYFSLLAKIEVRDRRDKRIKNQKPVSE